MPTLRIVDVTDDATFALIPPCADPGFDHRTCDYWEDVERGSKAARTALLSPKPPPEPPAARKTGNPFLDDAAEKPFNPFAVGGGERPANPFVPDGDRLAGNPFAPRHEARAAVAADAPRKLALLSRGLAVVGSYAKVLLADELAIAYAQFGPLSAYPRAMRLRALYPQLPDSPLPAVITCIATTADARRAGHARRLVEAICDDLTGRGFAAVEAYPERGTRPESTSAATPEFWQAAGFSIAVADDRFPVVRREL